MVSSLRSSFKDQVSINNYSVMDSKYDDCD